MSPAVRALQSPSQNHCFSCGEFMKIPPLIHAEDGRYYVNPDFEAVKKFYLHSTPGPEETIEALGEKTFALTVPAEENYMGDMLINELMCAFVPADGSSVTCRNVRVEILSPQNDRLFMNAPVHSQLLFGTGFMNCCLPCCIFVQATNSLQVRVLNGEDFDISATIVARGRRFLPYHDPELRDRMIAYWQSLPSTPYWLTIDDDSYVNIAAGATETVYMSVPGGGDLEVRRLLADVTGTSLTADDIDITITEGTGRAMMLVPLSLGQFVAISGRSITGMPNAGYWAPAYACSCEQYHQYFKRNSRIRIVLTNNAANTARVRLAWEGCMQYVGECAPGRSLDRARSLEPTVGPTLINSPRGMCPPVQQVQPMPGRGLVPVNAQSAPVVQPRPILGPGYGAALGPGFLHGHGPHGPQGQPNGRWRRI